MKNMDLWTKKWIESWTQQMREILGPKWKMKNPRIIGNKFNCIQEDTRIDKSIILEVHGGSEITSFHRSYFAVNVLLENWIFDTILQIIFILKLVLVFLFLCFFSIWIFFHRHSRFTVQQRKGLIISLTLLYHFHPIHRHLDISRVITAESSPLYKASSRTWNGNLWFRSASR